MLELLVAIALNSLQQRSERHLLFLSEEFLLFLEHCVYFLLHLQFFVFFLLVCLSLEDLGIVVSPEADERLYTLLLVHQVSRILQLNLVLLPDPLLQLLNLQQMLLLQLLKRQVRSRLIVTHIIIPRLRKFQKLRPLSILHRNQLPLLRLPHILLLPQRLLSLEVVELQLGALGLG